MTKALHVRAPMHVVGVTGQTSSATAMRDIAALWERAASLGVFTGPEAFAVYDHYQLFPGTTDYTVTVTVGRAATRDEVVPDGLVRVEVPEQTGALIVTDGSIAGVQQAWAEVWQRWPDGGARGFVADVEHWRMGPHGQPASAEIFIGMRG